MENPIKMDDQGYPYFRKPPYGGFLRWGYPKSSIEKQELPLGGFLRWAYPLNHQFKFWIPQCFGKPHKISENKDDAGHHSTSLINHGDGETDQ